MPTAPAPEPWLRLAAGRLAQPGRPARRAAAHQPPADAAHGALRPSLGYAPLRAHIAATLGERGIAVDAQRVLLTQGATQGLDIVVRTLLRPGDTMAVEQPCYANLFPILRLAQVRAVPVPRARPGWTAWPWSGWRGCTGPGCCSSTPRCTIPRERAWKRPTPPRCWRWPRAMISTSSRTTSRASCWMAGPRRWRDWMARGA